MSSFKNKAKPHAPDMYDGVQSPSDGKDFLANTPMAKAIAKAAKDKAEAEAKTEECLKTEATKLITEHNNGRFP